MKSAREPASSRPKPRASLNDAAGILPVHRSLLALVGRKQTMIKDQLFPQKPPSSRVRFSRSGVQYSPGSLTIELPSALAESGAYPSDSALAGSPRQCPLPLAFRHLPKGTKLELRRSAHLGNTILNQLYRRRVSTDRLNREDSQLTASLEG